jgi:hypothetical protein
MKVIFKKSKKNRMGLGQMGAGSILSAAIIFNLACAESPAGDNKEPVPATTNSMIPITYAFESHLLAGESSVNYSGQVARQILIKSLYSYIDGLTAKIDDQSVLARTGLIVEKLDFFYSFDGSIAGDTPHGLSSDLGMKQASIGDISTSAKLINKTAGNDKTGQYKDWNTVGLMGWPSMLVVTPEGLVRQWFQAIEDQAMARQAGNPPLDPSGAAITKTFVTPEGLDLKQLLQKFLMGAVSYSQGTDDYLDDDIAGKGLNSQNTTPEKDGKAYTSLEHIWDEGFGYFGAARDYKSYTDDEIAGKSGRAEYEHGYHDSNRDGKIDLKSEFNFGHAVNAANRDRGAATDAKTDYTEAAINAFLKGRHLISTAGGELSDEQMTKLKAQRDIIVSNWELAIASTTLHYINENLQDHAKFGTQEYDFYDHAKHWSELKGFALSLQFNPRKKISDTQLESLHTQVGDAPVLPSADASAITLNKQALLDARALLLAVYGFDAKNIGDDDGNNGW